MSVKALNLAKKMMESHLPQDSRYILSKNFITEKDASTWGFTKAENIGFANTLFSELNAVEKVLTEQNNVLLKELGPKVPWSYFDKYLGDKKTLNELKSVYDSIFENGSRVPAIKAAQEAEGQDSIVENVGAFEEAVNNRIKTLEDGLESEINPLLNPFGDFWVYEMDGPEFSEIFAARPQWNAIINRSADEFAFNYHKDPLLSDETQEGWKANIEDKLSQFVPSAERMDLIGKLIRGEIKEELLNHYDSAVLAKQEQDLLNEFTHDDNAALAMRTGFISTEADPMGKHFGGH